MKVKQILITGLVVSVMALAGGLKVAEAAAESAQQTTEMQFTWDSSMTVTWPADMALTLNNLSPNSAGTTNALAIIVNTNNNTGYKLMASVGSADNNSTNLDHVSGGGTVDGKAQFARIATNANLSELTTPGTWGYTYSTDGTNYSNYNGLAAYSASDQESNWTEVRSTDGGAANSTTYFKIGAYATENQLAGNYTNTVNFYIVTNDPVALSDPV